MHEAGIMAEALEMATAEAVRAGGSRIHRLRLRVGALSGVVPEALEFAFAALAPGSAADQARLEIEPVPAVAWCAPCRATFPAGDGGERCPGCRRPPTTLRQGLELELASVEVS